MIERAMPPEVTDSEVSSHGSESPAVRVNLPDCASMPCKIISLAAES
jgi:hypothetical protein